MTVCDGDPPLFDLTSNGTKAFLQQLANFQDSYSAVHRWLCVMICMLGIVLNTAHIFVLSRKQMRIFAINSILCVMAVCDVVTMISYLIYIVRFKILDNDAHQMGYPYIWLIFLMYHVVASIALHTVSLYLSVIMAYIRWTALDRLDSKWVRSRSVGHIFFFTCLVVAAVSIPTLMVHRIVPVKEVLPPDFGYNYSLDGLYTVTLDEQVLAHGCLLFKINLWITGICFKAFPCFLLFWFTCALIHKLCEMSEKRRRLRGTDPPSGSVEWSTMNAYSTINNARKKKLAVDKTTVMLIIMLTVFLCTELPQGLLVILNAIYTTHVHYYVYLNLGEVLDLLSLVNCNVGFVLYCFMSSRYRATFRAVFLTPLTRPANSNTYTLHSFKALIT
ncbi:unnamed protein product, partial [Mesorhabditis belari]|uniref:G-protein coupled receptors family 1 profile domain-containing protein n=1 Tax=Mesorhabditis belari TaxID=2138241 RepID=A0AAF3E8Z7_9BILA